LSGENFAGMASIVSWRSMPKGGHFPAMQVPDVYVDEVRRFFRAYR